MASVRVNFDCVRDPGVLVGVTPVENVDAAPDGCADACIDGESDGIADGSVDTGSDGIEEPVIVTEGFSEVITWLAGPGMVPDGSTELELVGEDAMAYGL